MTLGEKCQYICKTTLFRHKLRGGADIWLGYTLDLHFLRKFLQQCRGSY